MPDSASRLPSPTTSMLPADAVKLCDVDDIAEGAAKGLGKTATFHENIFAIKKRGQIFVYYNRCPHANLPLNWVQDQFLDFDKELIQCASHGALFRIETGQCVAGPCPGRYLQPVEFRIHDGAVWLIP